MSRTATTIVGWGIIVHLLMSIWMYGNKAIFESSFDSRVTFDHEQYEENYSFFNSDNLKQVS